MRRRMLTGFLILVSLALPAQGIPLCKEEVFRAGESLSMGIMFKWGAVNTEVAQARLILAEVPYGSDSLQVFHADCLVKSAPFFDVFFKMREHFQSWFSTEPIRPLEAVRDTYENGYTAVNHFLYDWEEGLIRAEVGYNGLPPEKKDIPMKGMSYDIVSMVYYLRSLDWDSVPPDQPLFVPFAIDDEVFQIQVTCRGPENFRIRKIGRCRTLHFTCSVVAGALFEGNQELQVWFSNDANRLPLAVMVPLKMGTMWAWIKSWSGLKNDFEARLS